MRIRFLFIAIAIALFGCSRDTAEFSAPINCLEDYDQIELSLEGVDRDVDRALEEVNGVVDFGTLEEGNYKVTALVFRDEFDDPVVRFEKEFGVPNRSTYRNLLDIPNPLEVDTINFKHEDFSSTARVSLRWNCSNAAKMYYSFSTDSAELLEVEEWILFSDDFSKESEVSIPMDEDEMYFTFKTEYDAELESYSTRSHIFSTDLRMTPYEIIDLGERYRFSTIDGGAYRLRIPVTQGKVYVVDLFDSANDAALTSVNTSLNVIDYYPDMRTSNESDSRRILKANSDAINIEAVNAFLGEPGSCEVMVREVDISNPIVWNDSISWNFDNNGQIIVTKTTIEAGDQVWRYEPQRGPDDQYIWLFAVETGEIELDASLDKFGPLGYADVSPRDYSHDVNAGGEVYIIATPSYFGEPTSASLSIQTE